MQEGLAELGNAVVQSMAYRPADGRLLVGTHGNGMWATTLDLSPLPVTLLTFDGALENNSTLLKWTTSSEQDTRNFEVQKSTDGANFQTIGTVAAAGNSSGNRSYSHRDLQVNEINYYRLKMNDIDGAFKYSNVVVIRNNAVTQQMRILNNPFTDQIQLRFTRQAKNLRLQLFNANGALVGEKQFTNAYEANWQVPAGLSKGVYVMRAVVDGNVTTNRLLKK
jgi:hypothetical protein